MRRRFRSLPDLDATYPVPHDHTRWADHIVRVDATVALAKPFVPIGSTVVDLSCGNGTIAKRLAKFSGSEIILGDYAPGYEIVGRIEDTIHALAYRQAGMFVLSETIEHLDDPDSVLKLVREKADWLVLSTPDGEQDGSRNPEHVWGWDAFEVDYMLETAGFETVAGISLVLRPAGFEYDYVIRVCR